MKNFADFHRCASEAFPDLHIEATMTAKATATSSGTVYYVLTARGQRIGAAEPSATGTSPEEAIRALVRLVAPARRAVREAAEEAQRQRNRRAWY